MNALWRRLDRPGHDAAFLRPHGDGWLLSGVAVFLDDAGPASIAYSVAADRHWNTIRGNVTGFAGRRSIDCDIRREADRWRLNGVAIEGLAHLLDLDLSFTPATNLLQLRRAAPQVGEKVSLPAAWFNLDEATLTELPQVYERLDETRYAYVAPTVSYEGLLEIASDGFIETYPNLWRREAETELLARPRKRSEGGVEGLKAPHPNAARRSIRKARAAGSDWRPIARS